ncbi:MAG: YjgB family protein [Gorillibacterium sp.]|nr:YjgB family protein [Gorillibacterium sp.]
MKPLVRTFTCSLMLVGVLALTACNSSSQSSAVPSSIATTTMASLDVSSSPSQSPSPSLAVSPSPTTVESAVPTKSPTTAVDSATSKQIKELLELAKQGKVPGIEYAAHIGLIEDVEKDWGKADKADSAGSSGIYWTYAKKNAVIGFNKGSLIFDVRSNDPSLQKLTLQQIKTTLGNPTDTKVNGDDTIYIYKVNDQYELKFIIPKSTGKVDHISVFSPQDAINNMAG